MGQQYVQPVRVPQGRLFLVSSRALTSMTDRLCETYGVGSYDQAKTDLGVK